MSSCEKCWSDAGGDADKYHELLLERFGNKRCTPEQMAGPDAKWCVDCGLITLHQKTGECMNKHCDTHDFALQRPGDGK